MEKGAIVEYIDRQRLVCGVLMESVVAEGNRLRLYTENNREMNLPRRRITHAGGYLDPDLGRKSLVDNLKATAGRRSALAAAINVEELWDLLREEDGWVSLQTIKEICFSGQTTPDHEAAVVRAMFADTLYFKFDHNRFRPRTEEQITAIVAVKEKEERERMTVEAGAAWLRSVIDGGSPVLDKTSHVFVDMLKRYYVFEKEAEDHKLTREMLARAGGVAKEDVFSLMVRVGVWDKHENMDFHRYGINAEWSQQVRKSVEDLVSSADVLTIQKTRLDLIGLPVFTIDGSATADYDDALSLEEYDDGTCRVGVHISDVAHFIEKESLLDEAARDRASSIYTVDQKVPMLPPELSEEACSLKAGELRPALSTFIRFSRFAEILDYEMVQSVIRVDRHLTYTDVDREMAGDRRLSKLYDLAGRLQEKRIHSGATPITIPDIYIQFVDRDRLVLSRVDQQSPSRQLVAEMMIVTNRLVADFLWTNQVPAVFRSQAESKQRLVKKQDLPGTLFQNWVQRKMMARGKLGAEPERHAGLGLDRYTTVTSPIRKYLDLVTQRQLKSALGTGEPYTTREIQEMVAAVSEPLSHVGKIQQARQRYWILKFLETRIGAREEAMVLDSHKDEYSVLLPEFLLECRMARSSGERFKPQDLIQVTIQHVNAFTNTISIYFG